MLFMVPAGTLATGTITMPSAPADGMVITFSSSQQITALTLQGNTGQSISGAVTFLPAQTAASYVYRLANTTWYPCETVPGTGSQLVSGTSQATNSGTSKDFTGIPSWVKRITVMLNGVSTNGSSNPMLQIGTSAGIETSGYISAVNAVTFGPSGFGVSYGTAAASTLSGVFILATMGSNVWVYSGVASYTAAAAAGGGTKTLSGTLDRVRLTTFGGTDTFDAGTINILYE
jgi:hypothetical protein